MNSLDGSALVWIITLWKGQITSKWAHTVTFITILRHFSNAVPTLKTAWFCQIIICLTCLKINNCTLRRLSPYSLFLRVHLCHTAAWAWPPHCLLSHASCQIAAVNNLLCDLFIWANSAGSLTPITLLVERLLRTASHCFTLKSIFLQTQKAFSCASIPQQHLSRHPTHVT